MAVVSPAKGGMDMAEEYRVVRYAPQHRTAVLDLHGRLLPRARSVTERYFAWKYEENPYIPDPLFALVFSGSDLVAMRGLCGTQWTTGDGAIETIPAAEDLIIHPAHRNRGLFLLVDRELTRIAADHGFARIVSLSANSATRGLQDVTGWQRVATFDGLTRRPLQHAGGLTEQPVVRRLRARGTAFARRSGIGVPQLVTNLSIERMLQGADRALPNIRSSATPEVENLASLSTAPKALHQRHTAEFYRWRLRNPDREYRYLYWGDGATQGYLILGLQPSNPQRVLIVDAGCEDDSHALDLINALACANRPSLTALPAALPKVVSERLPFLGFAPTSLNSDEPMVTVFVRQVSASDASDGRWHAALLDTMLG